MGCTPLQHPNKNVGGVATTPAAPANAVQFNNAGSFGGSSAFTYVGNALVVVNANNPVLDVTGHVLVKSGTTASELRLYEPSGSGSNYTAFKAQAQSADITYTLPAAAGTAGQVLTINASNVMSWETPATGGTPAAPTNAVQFNNAGAFGGSSNFTYASGVLTVVNANNPVLDVTGHVLVKSGTTASELRLYEPSGSGSNYTAFRAQAQSGDVVYTLPAAAGASGQVLQIGAGNVLSWVTPASGGSPGGSTFSVQYNNAGAFAGSANLQYNNSELLIQGVSSGSSALRIITGSGIHGIRVYGNGGSAAATQEGCAYFTLTNGAYPGIRIDCDNGGSLVATTPIITAKDMIGNQIFNLYYSGRAKFRGSGYNTNAIVEIPHISGDTLPTLYVGSASSNQAALSLQVASPTQAILITGNPSIGIQLNGTMSHGLYSAMNIDYGMYLGSCMQYGTFINAYTYGHFVAAAGSGAIGYYYDSANRTNVRGVSIDIANSSTNAEGLRINMFNNADANTFALKCYYGFSGSDYALTLNARGVLSIRSGLDAGGKMSGVGGQFFTNTTDAANSGTGETDLGNISIPANILGTNGDRIEIEASFEFAANSNTKTVKLKFGSAVLLTFSGSNSGSAGTAVVRATVIRDTSGGSEQFAYATFNGSNLPTAAGGNCTLPAETLSSAITVKCTGQGGATNDITQKTFSIKWFPKGQG